MKPNVDLGVFHVRHIVPSFYRADSDNEYAWIAMRYILRCAAFSYTKCAPV
jgi:hypothetical protein